MKALPAFALASLLLAASPAAGQATWVVDDDGRGSIADCDDALSTFSTPAAGIAAAAHGDIVLVCPGTYYGTLNFEGKAITLRSVAGPGLTILDGEAWGAVVTFDSGEGRSSVLEGFTIRNGRSVLGPDGGGIAISGASPVIRRNRITENWAYGGAGIGSYFGSPLVEDNTIAGNVTYSGGGWGGGVTIGGDSEAVVRRNVIVDNLATAAGGGILLNAAGAPVIEFNVISGNSAPDGGGVAMMNRSDALVRGNLIVHNRAARQGGGLSWEVPGGDWPLLVANTIAANDSPLGSGLYARAFGGGARMFNNLIVGSAGQAAVFCGSYVNQPPSFRSNDVFSAGGAAYEGSCADVTGIDGNISADPRFADPATGDFHLSPDSPAIDAGDDVAPERPDTDIDNHERRLDGDGDGIVAVDMGADESASGSSGSGPGPFVKTAPVSGSADISPGLVPLGWTQASGAASYEYCYDSTDNGVCDGRWLPAPAGVAAVFGLDGATTYYWQVRARNAAGTSYADAAPEAYHFFTTKTMAPRPFGKTIPGEWADVAGDVTLGWEPSQGATRYEYCLDAVDNGVCDTGWVSVADGTSVVISGLPSWTTWYWQVRAVNAVGIAYADRFSSSFWRFGIRTPAAFALLSPPDGARDQPAALVLRWEPAVGATGYAFCYDTIDNDRCDTSWIYTGWSTGAAVSGLRRGVTYHWMARAVNTYGTTSSSGSGWSFTTSTSRLRPGSASRGTGGESPRPVTRTPTRWP